MAKGVASRLFLLITAVSLSVAVAGCGEQKDSAVTNNTSSTPVPTEKVELTISAAASLTDSLKQIKDLFERENPNSKLNFNFGASGTLRQQIEQGAPVDLYLSADTQNMQKLVKEQLIDASQETNLLSNELDVVVPADGKSTVGNLEDLKKPDLKNIAIGDPQTVPAGSYAKDALTNAKLWDQLQTKIVFGKDVRQVLTYVESGNADVGFVYKTDALTSQKVKVAFSVDSKSYKPIQYPVGIVKSTSHLKQAQDFYTFLKSKEAQDIFVKYGFTVPK